VGVWVFVWGGPALSHLREMLKPVGTVRETEGGMQVWGDAGGGGGREGMRGGGGENL
jgi:hypothetical protein